MEKQLFTSRLTSILTLLGVAIGLGNVWRFPYMMGRYGGSAFLAVYISLTIIFAFPALMAELSLGQLSGKGTVDSLRIGFGKFWGNIFGYMLLVTVTVAGSYYAVVVANVIYTTLFSAFVGFSSGTNEAYHHWLTNGYLQYAFTLLLIALSIYVIYRGLIDGIERISKKVMPLFFLALVYMIIHALSMPGAIGRCVEFLKPDFGLLGRKEIFAALGQAFFSVGLGGTFVVVYAGFLKKDEKIVPVALWTGLGDASASLLISLFLVPSMLVFGLDMRSGPGLIFETFPRLFEVMPGGRFVGSLFLLSVSIVAFLSLVAAYQVPYSSFQHETKFGHGRILVGIGIVQGVLSLPSALFPDLIASLDLVFGSGMQVLGSALCILGFTWGLGRTPAIHKMFNTSSEAIHQKMFFFWIKWVIPMALLAVLAGYIYEVVQ